MSDQAPSMFQALESLKEEIYRTNRDMRGELLAGIKEVADLQRIQNGNVSNTIRDVAVLHERVDGVVADVATMGANIKDSTARWLSAGTCIGLGVIEMIRYAVGHKTP